MMTPIVLIVCLAGLLIGTFTDLKTREVPDLINYGLIFSGFGIALLSSLLIMDPTPIIESTLGFLFFLGIALVMYYTGQWGGGDSKMIMGLGALIGLNWPVSVWLSSEVISSGLPFLLNFLIFTVIVGAAYGILWSTGLAVIHRKKFIKAFKKYNNEKKIKTVKIFLITIVVAGIISGFFLPQLYKIMVWLMTIIIASSFYMFIYIKTIEKVCMYKFVSPEKLTIGDWIAEDVKVGGKIICGPKDLGVEKKQIEKLIRLKKKGKIKEILIKEGIPFVPSFLIAFILTMIFGSNIFYLLI